MIDQGGEGREAREDDPNQAHGGHNDLQIFEPTILSLFVVVVRTKIMNNGTANRATHRKEETKVVARGDQCRCNDDDGGCVFRGSGTSVIAGERRFFFVVVEQ